MWQYYPPCHDLWDFADSMSLLQGFFGSQNNRKSQIPGHLRIKVFRRMHPAAQKEHIVPVPVIAIPSARRK